MEGKRMSTVHISVLYLERDLFLNASIKKKKKKCSERNFKSQAIILSFSLN